MTSARLCVGFHGQKADVELRRLQCGKEGTSLGLEEVRRLRGGKGRRSNDRIGGEGCRELVPAPGMWSAGARLSENRVLVSAPGVWSAVAKLWEYRVLKKEVLHG